MKEKFVITGEYTRELVQKFEEEMEKIFPNGYARYKVVIIEVVEER